MCLCETKKQAGRIAPSWGSADLLDKVSRDMGNRSNSIEISCHMGPLRAQLTTLLSYTWPRENGSTALSGEALFRKITFRKDKFYMS